MHFSKRKVPDEYDVSSLKKKDAGSDQEFFSIHSFVLINER